MKMGMEYAYAQGADYIIWLNDDVIPRPNTLSSLINFLQNHPHSIAAPTCLADSHRTVIPNGCIGNTPIIASPNQVIAVQSVSGYCVAFPAEICQTSGYPDSQRYPHYSGDDMYTLQAHRQGFAIYLLGGIEVILINYQPSTDKRKLTEYIHYPFHQATKLTFFQIKSPFYLPSQYNYLTQKYNLFIGSLLFLIKMTRWLILFSYYLLIANIHHESPTSP
jgi:GT2 family glycosyltransferase